MIIIVVVKHLLEYQEERKGHDTDFPLVGNKRKQVSSLRTLNFPSLPFLTKYLDLYQVYIEKIQIKDSPYVYTKDKKDW